MSETKGYRCFKKINGEWFLSEDLGEVDVTRTDREFKLS